MAEATSSPTAKMRSRAGSADASGFIVTSEFNRTRATFANKELERNYRRHLATTRFHHEQRLQIIAIGVFLSYGLLDFLVVDDLGHEFLTLRFLIVAPAVALCVALTSAPTLRRYVEYSTILGLGAFAAAIIYMIDRMPPGGAPPYIIGLLVVMIFTSCLMRISFVLAAPTYFIIGAAHCLILILREGISSKEVISELFFMISVAGVAVITIYTEEMRARKIWFRDEQRRADTARIERLLVDATAADQSKLNFLSILTHELRTPLHQIIGYSEVLKNLEAPVGEARGATLDNIIDPAKDLLKKLGQMLRYADATAGKLTFCFDAFSIREVAESAADQLRESAAIKGVRIDLSGVQDQNLRMDQHHTMYALTCLLENALAASPAGSSIAIGGKMEDGDIYRLTIRDSGCGMTERQIAAAFSPFEQNEGARSRAKQGLGLGLTISKRLLTEQAATLGIASTPGFGTVATIDFSAGQLQRSTVAA